MGSTGHFIGSDPSWQGSVKKYLDMQHTSTYGTSVWEVLASMTKGGVYYAAVKRTNFVTDFTETFAVVQPYKIYGRSWERQLIVKDQDETAGPFDCEASARILDLLTETDNENANAWRERCRANLAAKAAKPKIEVDDVLVFAQPFKFTGKGEVDTFVVMEWGRRKRFIAKKPDGGWFTCRLTRWALSTEYIVEKGSTHV